MFRSTGVAASLLPFPACVARKVHVPGCNEVIENELLLGLVTEHTKGVWLVTVTVCRVLVEAVAEIGVPYVPVDGGLKVINWGQLKTCVRGTVEYRV
jgi:hypothetical protein